MDGRSAEIMLLVLIGTLLFPKVLLLYKSSENGYGYSLLKTYIVPSLNEIGESYDFVDIEKGFPNFSGYEMVISCYYSSKMKGAKSYLRKLEKYLSGGGKLFVINNLGAFSDPNGPSPSLADLNSVFNLLGVEYEYGWKKIVAKYSYDERYLTGPVPKNKVISMDEFEVFAKKTKVILSVKDSGKIYPLVFFNRKGGVALYDSAFNEKGVPFLNLGKIVKEIILDHSGNIALFLGRNESVEEMLRELHFTIVRDTRRLSRDPEVVFDFNKDLKDVESYLKKGITVVWITTGDKVAEGTVNLDDSLDIPRKVPTYNTKVRYFSAPGEFTPLLDIDGKAVAWLSGNLVYFPADLAVKEFRGVILDSVMMAAKRIAIPIVNGFAIFLDDFPLPAYNVKRKMITREFGDITDGEFYYDIWWKDMEKLAKDLNLHYISALVTAYSDKPYPPYDFMEFLESKLPIEFLERSHENLEVNLHGYNHLSPISKNWNEENLIEAYRSLDVFLENICDFEPVVFVAPNNKVDWMGAEAVKRVFPTVEVLGTAYYGDESLDFGEFGYRKGFVIIPRTTSGYYPMNRLLYQSISTVLSLGTYQYFIHPDDLFSKDRNPSSLKWKTMLGKLKEFLKTMKTYYPWLRMLTGKDIAVIFKDYFESVPKIVYSSESIMIKFGISVRLPRYFFVKAGKDMRIKGGKLIYAMKNFKVVEMTDYEMIINFVKK